MIANNALFSLSTAHCSYFRPGFAGDEVMHLYQLHSSKCDHLNE